MGRSKILLLDMYGVIIEESKEMDFCLLSNDVLEWSEFLTDYHGLNDYFQQKIVSGQVHMRKLDKEMW